MINKNIGRNSFTLAELMIVVSVVIALAAIALPDIRPAMRRYKAREAIAGLRSIEAHMRLNRAKTRFYNRKPNPNPNSTGTVIIAASSQLPASVVGRVPGFRTNDLNGAYFRDNDYKITSLGSYTFTIRAAVAANDPRTQVAGITITINNAGEIKEIGY